MLTIIVIITGDISAVLTVIVKITGISICSANSYCDNNGVIYIIVLNVIVKIMGIYIYMQ